MVKLGTSSTSYESSHGLYSCQIVIALHLTAFFFLHDDPIYLQAVIIHSANGGKG
jgi:hypothetical protein